jgi:hypothetical protein
MWRWRAKDQVSAAFIEDNILDGLEMSQYLDMIISMVKIQVNH